MNMKLITPFQVYRMDSGSGSIVRGCDPTCKYCTLMEGNINGTISNYCGMVIKSGVIIRFKFYLSDIDPHSNSNKKCPNIPVTPQNLGVR